MAKPKSVQLTDLQRAYFASIAAERDRIARDFQIAAGVALAGAEVDFVQGMGISFDGKSLVYTLPGAPKPIPEKTATEAGTVDTLPPAVG